MLWLTRVCENCGGRNIGPCPTQIEGIDYPGLSKCFCCNEIFETKLNELNEHHVIVRGEK